MNKRSRGGEDVAEIQKYTLSIPSNLLETVKAECKKEKISVNEYILRLIKNNV